jgi:riboflavin kinase/FMN adenylyltransferase
METAKTPAREFIQQLAQAARPLGCVSVGYAWNFGHQREGDIHLLMEMGQRHDFAVYGVPPLKIDGAVVSSTLIREAVSSGDLAKAALFLGREYSVFGTVVEGLKLGRQLGFRTANVEVENEQLPPLGVYAVQARLNGEWLPAVANLGRKPTVTDNADPSLEVHLFGWDGDLYGKDLEVRFARFLRPEMKFSGLDELKSQISRDIEAARW